MVKKMLFLKSYLRDIIKNRKIFLPLTLIVGIILGTHLCLLSCAHNIKSSYQEYLKKNNLYDLKITTSSLFSKEDKALIKALDNVDGVKLVKTLDVMANVNNNSYNVRLNSISNDRSLTSADYINHLTLTKGRYPRTINEGLVEEKLLYDNKLSLNDLIVLKPKDEDSLRAKKIKIVGTIKSSYYNLKENEEKEDNNKIDYYVYLDEKDFNTNYYNECFITTTNIKKIDISFLNDVIKENSNKKNKDEIISLESEVNFIKEKLNSLYTSDLPSNNLNYEIKNLSEELDEKENKLESIKNLDFNIEKRDNNKSTYSYKNELNIINNFKKTSNKLFILVSIFCISIIYLVIKNNDYLKFKECDNYKLLFKYILYSSLIIFIGSLISILFFKLTSTLIGNYFQKNYDFIFVNKLNIHNFVSRTFILYLLNIAFILLIYILNTININKKVKIKKENFTNAYLICLLAIPFIILFQIKTSILNLPNKQFNNIFKYDMVINLNKNINDEEKKLIYNKIKNNKNITKYMPFYKESIRLIKNKTNVNGDIIIFKDEKKVEDFVKFKSKSKIVISKNLAKKLNVNKNDTIKLVLNDKNINVKIDDIAKNYIGNYIYMNHSSYEKLTDNNINYSSILTINKKDDLLVKKDLENYNGIYNIKLKNESKITYLDMLSLVNTIFIILIIYAFIINCIIIYNLAVIRVNNRKDEIANLKLLGVYDSYITNNLFKINKRNMIICLLFILSLSTLFSFFILNSFENSIFNYKLTIISPKYLCILPIFIIFVLAYKLMIYLNVKKVHIVRDLKNY